MGVFGWSERLVCKAHILLYHSTLGVRVIKKKKKKERCKEDDAWLKVDGFGTRNLNFCVQVRGSGTKSVNFCGRFRGSGTKNVNFWRAGGVGWCAGGAIGARRVTSGCDATPHSTRRSTPTCFDFSYQERQHLLLS